VSACKTGKNRTVESITYERSGNLCQILAGNLKEIYYLVDVDVDSKIILKWILYKIACDGAKSFQVVQDNVQQRAVLNTVLKLWVSLKAELTS
jgi:hypothetical protein